LARLLGLARVAVSGYVEVMGYPYGGRLSVEKGTRREKAQVEAAGLIETGAGDREIAWRFWVSRMSANR
jgi:putative transposase